MADIDIRCTGNGQFAMFVDNEFYAEGNYEYISEMSANFHMNDDLDAQEYFSENYPNDYDTCG